MLTRSRSSCVTACSRYRSRLAARRGNRAALPQARVLRGGRLSEGRGTSRPLRTFGASCLTDAPDAARELNALGLPGVRFTATRRAVRKGEKFGGLTIPMIDVVVTNRDMVEPVATGGHMLRVVHRRNPDRVRYQARGPEALAKSRELREAITAPGAADVVRVRVDTLLREWTEQR